MTKTKTQQNRAGFGLLPALTAGLLTVGALTAHASADYGPAIWRPACSGHWNTSGSGHKFLVIHDMEGYYAYEVSTSGGLRSCSTTVSVHYGVNGKKDAASDYAAGEVTQFVSEANYAWHAKCWNGHSAGTEHEGFRSNPAWFTPELYSNSAALQRHMADHYGIAKDRNHIVGHDAKSSSAWVSYANSNLGINASCNTHDDPGPYWDWTGFMNLINSGGVVRGTPVSTVIDTGGDKLLTFAINSDTSVGYVSQQTETSWGAWQGLGGVGFYSISGLSINAKFMCFGVGNSGPILYNYQSTVAGPFSGWVSLGGAGFTKVKAVKLPDGRAVAFGTSTSSDIFYNVQSAAGSTTWSGWIGLGGSGFDSIDPVVLSDGRLGVVGCGTGGPIYANVQTTAGGSWGGFVNLGGSGFNYARAVVRPGNLLAAFGTGNSTDIWVQNQNSGGTWPGAWTAMGGSGFSHVEPAVLSDGRMAFFAGVVNSAPWYKVQTAVGSTWPAGFSSLAGTGFGSFDLIVRSSDRLNVLGHGSTGGHLLHSYQSTAGGAFSSWLDVGGSLAF